MKKLLYLLFAITLLGCGSNDDDSPSNNGDYFFEVEFAGVINRVQGNTSTGLSGSFIPWLNGRNQCYGNIGSVVLSISDITAENYVSGQNMEITMSFDNTQLGSNNGRLNIFDGFYIEEYLESIGANSSQFVENIGDGFSQRGKISNINITDLGIAGNLTVNGTSTTNSQTIKGSYEKVVYFRSINTGDYDIPVPIRIEFSAVRL
jgi:hypothetical protein